MAFTVGQRVTYTGHWGTDRPARIVRLDRTVIASGQRLVRWIVHLDGVGNVHATDAMLAVLPVEETVKRTRRPRTPKPVEPVEQSAPDETLPLT